MGKVHFNVKDIFGNNHKEVEVIRVYENTASILDVNTNLTWIVRKRELGLEETNPNNKISIHVILIIEKPNVNGKVKNRNWSIWLEAITNKKHAPLETCHLISTKIIIPQGECLAWKN